MKLLKIFVLLLFVGISTKVSAQPAVDMLNKFLNSTKSMEAKFQQKLLDQGGLLLQQSAGTFTLKRPGKFMWNYLIPYPQQIVSNGKKIWIYDSELEQVSIKPYSQILSGAPVILLDQQKDLQEEFVLKDHGVLDGVYWVSLFPKQTETEFKQIRVGLQNNIMRQMMLVDSFEQTTIIEFEHLKVNPELKDTEFEFEIPEGTDVVGDY